MRCRAFVYPRLCAWLAVAIGAVLLWAGALDAAVEFAYLRAVATSAKVRIEWGTVQEYNVAAFRVLCKKEDEPDTSYQPIGNPVPAKGSLEEGAEYRFIIAKTALKPGVSYCFAVEELTTDEAPGDFFPLCGYGLDITPTATATLTPTVTLTDTPAPTVESPLATPTPTVTEPATPEVEPTPPTPTSIPLPTVYVVATFTPTPTPLAIPPTLTPLPMATGTPFVYPFGVRPEFLSPNMLIFLLCIGGMGVGALSLMVLVASMVYIRSRD